jgi:hypothetical protein
MLPLPFLSMLLSDASLGLIPFCVALALPAVALRLLLGATEAGER